MATTLDQYDNLSVTNIYRFNYTSFQLYPIIKSLNYFKKLVIKGVLEAENGLDGLRFRIWFVFLKIGYKIESVKIRWTVKVALDYFSLMSPQFSIVFLSLFFILFFFI